jgi:hypothetical protein
MWRDSSATRSELSAATVPSAFRRLFSNPIRGLPPRRQASTRKVVSAGPKAQTAQSATRPLAASRSIGARRSSGLATCPALFLFGDRSAGQLPFAARVRPRQHDDAAIAAAQGWIADALRRSQPGRRHDGGLGPRPAHLQAPVRGRDRLRAPRLRALPADRGGQADARDHRRPDRGRRGEVGYSEPAAFRRVFKRATGISPHEYRKRFRWISPAARSEPPAGPALRPAVGR